jgi:hypothetical protein
MDDQLNELIDTLIREQALLREYLGLLTRQHEHLIRNNLEGLKGNAMLIDALTDEAANLECRRRLLLLRLSERAGTDADSPDISDLSAILDASRFKQLERFKEALLEFHRRIDEQEARNETLIEQSVKMISQTTRFIDGVDNPSALCPGTDEKPAGDEWSEGESTSTDRRCFAGKMDGENARAAPRPGGRRGN